MHTLTSPSYPLPLYSLSHPPPIPFPSIHSAAEESHLLARQLSEEIRAYSRLSLAAPGAVPALLGVGGGAGGAGGGNITSGGGTSSTGGGTIFSGGGGGGGGGVGESLVSGRWLWTSGRLAIEPFDASYALQYALLHGGEGSSSIGSSSGSGGGMRGNVSGGGRNNSSGGGMNSSSNNNDIDNGGGGGSSGWIWWDQQAANAAPSLLLWKAPGNSSGSLGLGGREAMSITAVLPGLYR